MELTEIKNEIQRDIDKINDAELLDVLKVFIETHLLNSGEPKFTEEQIRRLNISRKQAEHGEFFTNEEVDREIDKWLKEKE
jgi:hypothetical protein